MVRVGLCPDLPVFFEVRRNHLLHIGHGILSKRPGIAIASLRENDPQYLRAVLARHALSRQVDPARGIGGRRPVAHLRVGGKNIVPAGHIDPAPAVFTLYYADSTLYIHPGAVFRAPGKTGIIGGVDTGACQPGHLAGVVDQVRVGRIDAGLELKQGKIGLDNRLRLQIDQHVVPRVEKIPRVLPDRDIPGRQLEKGGAAALRILLLPLLLITGPCAAGQQRGCQSDHQKQCHSSLEQTSPYFHRIHWIPPARLMNLW